MLEAIVFYTLAAFILGFGVLVVTARNTVHSVLFLVANFLCVAVMYVRWRRSSWRSSRCSSTPAASSSSICSW